MKKGIIILTGTPQGLKQFTKTARDVAWVWGINPKDAIADFSRKLGKLSGEDDCEVEPFASQVLSLSNKQFDYEKRFLDDKIGEFLSDTSPLKKFRDKTYNRFILVLTGISKGMYTYLEEEYGAFQIHVAETANATAVSGKGKILHDYVVCYDDNKFPEKLASVIQILTED